MPKPRHLKLSHGPIACSPYEAIKPYGGKRVTEDSELVTCRECLEIAAKLVEQQLSPADEDDWRTVVRAAPLSKFDLSLGARARVRIT